MEKDDEVKGEGNSIDFGARMYDPRVGRWFATDALQGEYPSFSPYNYVLNSPIVNIDPDGKRVYFVPGLGHDKFNPSMYVKSMAAAYGLKADDYGNASSQEYLQINGGSRGMFSDMLHVLWRGSFPTLRYQNSGRIHDAAKEIADGVIDAAKTNANEPVSIVGASQGSVTAAQATIQLLEHPERYDLPDNFTIDNLVLVGSPIQKGSAIYNQLQGYVVSGRIKNFEYSDFQASHVGKIDLVTGIAGYTPVDGAVRSVLSIFTIAASVGVNAALNNPGIGDYHIDMSLDENFGEKMREMFKNNLRGDDKNNDVPTEIK